MSERCENRHMVSGARCDKPSGHVDYHWHVGSNLTQAWGLSLAGFAAEPATRPDGR